MSYADPGGGWEGPRRGRSLVSKFFNLPLEVMGAGAALAILSAFGYEKAWTELTEGIGGMMGRPGDGEIGKHIVFGLVALVVALYAMKYAFRAARSDRIEEQ